MLEMNGWKDGEIDGWKESHRSFVKRMYKHDGCIQKSLPSVRCLSKDLKHIILCHIMSSLGGRGAINRKVFWLYTLAQSAVPLLAEIFTTAFWFSCFVRLYCYWGHLKLSTQQQRRLWELNTTRHIAFTGRLSRRPKCPLSSCRVGTFLAKP